MFILFIACPTRSVARFGNIPVNGIYCTLVSISRSWNSCIESRTGDLLTRSETRSRDSSPSLTTSRARSDCSASCSDSHQSALIFLDQRYVRDLRGLYYRCTCSSLCLNRLELLHWRCFAENFHLEALVFPLKDGFCVKLNKISLTVFLIQCAVPSCQENKVCSHERCQPYVAICGYIYCDKEYYVNLTCARE